MVVYPALARSMTWLEYIPDFGAPTYLGDVSEEWHNTLSADDKKAVDIVDRHSDAEDDEETNLHEYISAGVDPHNLHLLPWYRVEILMEEQGVEV
jgi:hypothetical protein